MIHEVPSRQNEFNSMTEFAMNGIEFRPIVVGVEDDADFDPPENADDFHVYSGSIRRAEAYSAALAMHVGVTEVFTVASKGIEGTKWGHHRLMVEYKDSEGGDELCLDRGIFCLDNDADEKDFDIAAASDRVMKALCAVAELRLGLT